MIPSDAIKAGVMALTQKRNRELFDTRCPVTMSVTVAGKTLNVMLDPVTTRAVLNAADLDLSNRLQRLGVGAE